jgi:polyketide biosynthesis acyl carrier protein
VTRSEIFTVVKTNIRNIVEEAHDHEIEEEMSMSDLGADSLQIVEVISRAMKDLRLRVPRTDLMNARNLKELVDLFERAQINPITR